MMCHFSDWCKTGKSLPAAVKFWCMWVRNTTVKFEGVLVKCPPRFADVLALAPQGHSSLGVFWGRIYILLEPLMHAGYPGKGSQALAPQVLSCGCPGKRGLALLFTWSPQCISFPNVFHFSLPSWKPSLLSSCKRLSLPMLTLYLL